MLTHSCFGEYGGKRRKEGWCEGLELDKRGMLPVSVALWKVGWGRQGVATFGPGIGPYIPAPQLLNSKCRFLELWHSRGGSAFPESNCSVAYHAAWGENCSWCHHPVLHAMLLGSAEPRWNYTFLYAAISLGRILKLLWFFLLRHRVSLDHPHCLLNIYYSFLHCTT